MWKTISPQQKRLFLYGFVIAFVYNVTVGASVVFEVSSRNASWVTMGIFGGLIYGFITSGDGDNAGGRIFSCALVGGAVMGIIGNILLWANVVETSCLITQKHGKTLQMYNTESVIN